MFIKSVSETRMAVCCIEDQEYVDVNYKAFRMDAVHCGQMFVFFRPITCEYFATLRTKNKIFLSLD